MFTGIVEKTVKVVATAENTMFRRLTLATDWTDIKLGDSVAINGACLTIAEIGDKSIGFDVIKETLDKTNLGTLEPGHDVNVERSLQVGARLDGHFVQGHVDGTGELVKQVSHVDEFLLTVRAPGPLVKYLAPKGSISIDGVSLTIAALEKDLFTVALIPTTLKLTTLGSREVGWRFNLEADILSKTIVHYLEARGV